MNNISCMKIFLTGPPGSGKTTAVLKIYETLKLYGYRVGGFITQEHREGGRRIGFRILTLDTGETGWLAHINFKNGPKISKYYVDVDSINRIAVASLERAIRDSDIIIVDEIGPMELTSAVFRETLKKILHSNKIMILTVHHKISSRLYKEFKISGESILYMITEKNREAVPLIIWREIKRGLRHG